MSSRKTPTDPFALDLERDMPLTPEDLAALERARKLRPLLPEDYQRWVDLMELIYGPVPRINPDSEEPFTL